MPARSTGATSFADYGHLRRHDLGLNRRCQLLRFGQPKSKISQASLLIALDVSHLSLRHHTRPKLRHQLHPRHTSFGTRPTLFP
jgi:hypothetical protein